MKIKCEWNCFGDMKPAELVGHNYIGGAKAIEVFTDDGEGNGMEPWSMATVNLPGQQIPEDCVFIKDYSENEGTVDNLVREGIIEPDEVTTVSSGWVCVSAYRLTGKGLKLWKENDDGSEK